MIDFRNILQQFGLNTNSNIVRYGNGLINSTFLVNEPETGKKFILQQVNKNVFKNPFDIDFNISLIRNFLSENAPGYFISLPLFNINNTASMVEENGAFYRIFHFIPNTTTFDTVNDANQAYGAAYKFGEFTSTVRIDPARLKITIPNFHNLELRYNQFHIALKTGNTKRINEAKELIKKILSYSNIVTQYKTLINSSDFKSRVTHHDTKISNVLFDHRQNALSVIDLDTIMPGHFISDFGDMMRTYLPPVSEEEPDFSKIHVRKEIYVAIRDGYLQWMGDQLSSLEKEHLFYSGQFMVFMQALRFLTDFLNMDIYYGSKYEGQNFVRAANQLTLLDRLFEFEKSLDQ